MHQLTSLKRTLCLLLVVLISLTTQAHAQGISLIRDAEIEAYLYDIANPMMKAAGLSPEHLTIYIVNEKSLNAFVSGGQNLFLHTGLIQHSKDPSLLIGVIAHEIGHIKGGHIIRKGESISAAGKQSIVGYVLGLASVAAGAPPEAAAAIITGSQHLATRNFLKYSRQFEQAADQSALDLLEQTNQSPKGLLQLLKDLHREHGWTRQQIDPYAQTHPITTERMAHIENYLANTPERPATDPKLVKRHQYITAKLDGFLESPKYTINTLNKKSSLSPKEEYALAIANYRYPNLEKALKLVNNLIEKEPDNGYFWELKGQMLFENGHIDKAITAYEQAVNILPNSSLIKTGLALSYMSKQGDNYIKKASQLLEQCAIIEPKNSFIFRQLGIAYGRMKKLDYSYTYLAEAELLGRNKPEALRFLSLAKQQLDDKNKQLNARWNDLKIAADKLPAKKKKR